MTRRLSFIIYSIVFFSFFDLFSQLPVMSTFAVSVGATPFLAGFTIAIYSLANTFGNMLSGIWTDRKGAYVVLMSGLLLSSVSLVLYQFVEDATTLLTVRVIHGFVAGLIVPAAFTLSANATANDRQGRKVALTGSFVGLAAIIGPAFSGILANATSVPTVFQVVACLGLIVTLIAFPLRRQRAVAPKQERTKRTLRPAKASRLAYVGAFLLMFSQGGLAFLLPLHVAALGFDSRLSGTLLSTFGIVAVLVFVLPTNRLADRVDVVKLTTLGIGLLGVSQSLIGWSDTQGMLYGVLGLYGVGFAILFPAINQLLIQSTTRENRGKSYGYFYAFFSLGTVFGSTLLGALPFQIAFQFQVTAFVLIGASLVYVVLARRIDFKQEDVQKSVTSAK